MEQSGGEYELAFSENALSTVSSRLDGRLAVYIWVTRHHRSVYASALLRELLRELDGTYDGNCVHRLVGSRRSVGRRRSSEVTSGDGRQSPGLESLYDRFTRRDFLSSVWEHRLAYENKIDGNAREGEETFEDQIEKNADSLESKIATDVGINEGDV